MSDHAWLLLEQGRHSQLVALQAALAFLPAGLAGLMAAYRDSYVAVGAPGVAQQQQQQQQQQPASRPATTTAAADAADEVWWAPSEPPPPAAELAAAVRDAARDLPVWEGDAVEADAAAALALCRSLGAAKWGVALGVLLVDAPTLAPYARAHAALWREFCAALAAEPALSFMAELVDALRALPGTDADGGAAAADAYGGAAQQDDAAGGGNDLRGSGEARPLLASNGNGGGHGGNGGGHGGNGGGAALAAAKAGVGSYSAMVQLG